jgi:hypothetical protein
MLMQILTHTPHWVFVIFALLLWLGSKQLFSGSVSLTRVTLLPVAMTGLSIYGVLSAFDSPVALLGWAVTGALLLFVVQQRKAPEGTRYDVDARRFHLRGSAVPLLLMMGIFFTKYVVGVALAMHPELRHDAVLAVIVPSLYGAFSGIFAGRAARLWKMALREDRAISAAMG